MSAIKTEVEAGERLSSKSNTGILSEVFFNYFLDK